jgi:peptide/nickel transport system substrate-binding protein
VTEIQFTSRSVSRRTVIKGAAATAAAIPLSQLLGGEVGAAGKVLRIGASKPNQTPVPGLTSDAGSLQILGCVGEWLAWTDEKGALEPRVAESWKASNGLKTWTFKIRKGIKFHDGTPLTVDDVVWTFKWHVDPKNASNQLGNFKGIFDAAGVVKVDASTVQFNLLDANANFPYIVASNPSYGSLIIKNGTSGGAGWEKTMIAAGPWKLESYTEGVKTVFVRNEDYWDAKRIPSFEKLELVQFVSAAAAMPQLKTGKLDAIIAAQPADVTKLNKAKFQLQLTPSARTIHTHMRCDWGPFTDKRVRRAAALTFDRAGYIKGVLKGFGSIGNDCIMDAYPTKDTSVPQRDKDLTEAKALMAAAGNKGFSVDLSSWKRDDIDALAQVIKTSFKQIGINVTLKIDGSGGGGSVYYTYVPYPSKKGVIFEYDNNSWLASNLGITDWGGRPTPDVYLKREYMSTADWSAAHYNSAAFDAAANEYLTAASNAKKKAASKKMQVICLEDVPYMLPYYDVSISPQRKGLTGVLVNGMSQVSCHDAKG